MIPFSDEDLKPAVESILDTKVKPALALDGGGIKLIDVKDAVVYVELQGACVGCPSSATTLKNTVEKSLRSYIHPELKVVSKQRWLKCKSY